MPASAEYFDANIAPNVDTAALRKILVPKTYAGDPTNNVTPDFKHQFCHDTANAALYWASTTASSGWKKLSP